MVKFWSCWVRSKTVFEINGAKCSDDNHKQSTAQTQSVSWSLGTPLVGFFHIWFGLGNWMCVSFWIKNCKRCVSRPIQIFTVEWQLWKEYSVGLVSLHSLWTVTKQRWFLLLFHPLRHQVLELTNSLHEAFKHLLITLFTVRLNYRACRGFFFHNSWL